MPELLLFGFGLVIGSGLGVLIYRLPRGEAILQSPRCTICGAELSPMDQIPVISFLSRHGRCRYCGAASSARSVLVELLTGVLFVGCYLVFGLEPELAKALALAAFLLVVTFIDYDYQLILDKVLIWMAGTGIIINLVLKYAAVWLGAVGWHNCYLNISLGWMDMAIAVLAGGVIMLVLAIISRGGMGRGDIKFAAVLGLWLGWKLTLLTILLSFVIGGVTGALLLLLKIKGRKDFIPFGPFIAIGAFIALLYGQHILAWYFR